MPKCGACSADVTFKRSGISEHSLILDEKPRKDVIVVPRSVARLFDERVAPGEQGDPFDRAEVAIVVDVWTDHHATCGYAELFRGDQTNLGRTRRLAQNAEELLQLARAVALHPVDELTDGRLIAITAEAQLLVEAIEP